MVVKKCAVVESWRRSSRAVLRRFLGSPVSSSMSAENTDLCSLGDRIAFTVSGLQILDYFSGRMTPHVLNNVTKHSNPSHLLNAEHNRHQVDSPASRSSGRQYVNAEQKGNGQRTLLLKMASKYR